jgi:hypothetical protein
VAQDWSDPTLTDKLHIFLSNGDILIDKEQFDKVNGQKLLQSRHQISNFCLVNGNP